MKSEKSFGSYSGIQWPYLRLLAAKLALVPTLLVSLNGDEVPFQFVEPAPVYAGSQLEKLEVPATRSGDVVWADFNGDHVLDFAVAGLNDQGGRSLSIYHAATTPSGRKEFVLSQDQNGIVGHPLPDFPSFRLTGFKDVDLLVQDFNADGWPDLVAVGETEQGFQAHLFANIEINPNQTGDIRVLEHWISDAPNFQGVRAGIAGGGFDMADYDRDGIVDVALTGITGPGQFSSSIIRGFSPYELDELASENLIPLALGDVAWMDYDLDGWPDLALCGQAFNEAVQGSATLIYRNNQQGGFELMHNIRGVQMGDLAWGDINRDGWPDLAVTGLNTQFGQVGTTAWFENEADPQSDDSRNFRLHILTDGMREGQLSLADLDLDGWLDLVAVGTPEGAAETEMRVYLNNNGVLVSAPEARQWLLNSGDGTIGEIPIPNRASFALGAFPENAVLQSGYGLDLILVGGEQGQVEPMKTIHASSPITTFKPLPAKPPANSLEARVLGLGLVEFSWERSPHDTEGVRTWDLEIGEHPDSESYRSSLTSEYSQGFGTSHFRTSPVPGSMGSKTSAILRSPGAFQPGELLFWRVEAIDGAFRTSGFQPDPIYRAPYRIPYFIPEHQGANLGLAGGIDAGDFDRDGDLDIIVGGTSGMQLWENDIEPLATSSTWSERPAAWDAGDQPIPFPDQVGGSIKWGDVNGDNYLDILVAGTPDAGVAEALILFINESGNGRREFSRHVIRNSGALQGTAEWIDFDLDGDLDIAVVGGRSESPFFALLRNDFNPNNPELVPNFTRVQGLNEIREVGVYPTIAVDDYDRDGWPDLIIAGHDGLAQEYLTILYRNGGPDPLDASSWQWEPQEETILEGVKEGSLRFGDWDEDGWPDLFLTGKNGVPELFAKLYINRPVEGAGGIMKRGLVDAGEIVEFNTSSLAGIGYNSGDILPADLNHDGRLDLVLIGTTSQPLETTVWIQEFDDELNQRQFVLVEEASSSNLSYGPYGGVEPFIVPGDLPGTELAALAPGDFNLDGRIDLAMVGRDAPAGIFLNNWSLNRLPQRRDRNIMPVEPDSISMVYTPGSNEALIQWEGSSDYSSTFPDTPAAAISYRVAMREMNTDTWWISPNGTELWHPFLGVTGIAKFGEARKLDTDVPGFFARSIQSFQPQVGQRFEVAVQAIDLGYAASAWTKQEVEIHSIISGRITNQDDVDQELPGWTVFWDINDNGQLDGAEPSALTGAEGKYDIFVSVPGSAPVRQILQPGWVEVEGPANPVEIVAEDPATINVADFTNVFQSGSVYGRLWQDTNGDGVVNPEEEDLNLFNWTIFADYNENGALDPEEPSTASLTDGRYILDGVGVGQHRIRIDPASIPNNWERTFPAAEAGPVLNIINGETIVDVNFGYRPLNGDGGNIGAQKSALKISGMQESTSGSEVTLNFDILIPGDYQLERSTDLKIWQSILSISAGQTTASWVETLNNPKVFFRLTESGSTTTSE